MNNTQLTFTINYDLSEANYDRLKEIVGSTNFTLVPKLNDIDIYTYYKSGDSAQYSFVNLFTWGSSFNSNSFGGKIPQWTYSKAAAGTNTISYSTSDYNSYLKDTTDLSLSSEITFGVYATSNGAPTGEVLTTIDYSSVMDVSCTFTEKTGGLPKKGDLISMILGNEIPEAGTNNLYRVLNIDENTTEAEVVAMFDIKKSQKFGSGDNTYSDSLLDTLLNTTWYGTLNDTAKAAIVANDINQYQYPTGSCTDTHRSYADYTNKSLKENVGSRYVYALDVEDIEKYFGGSGGSASANAPGTYSSADLWTLFWNTTSKPSNYTYPWLRSASSSISNYVFCVSGNSGYVYNFYYGNSDAARPAFKIKLSEINYVIQVGESTN